MTERIAGDLTDRFLCYICEDCIAEFLEYCGANSCETIYPSEPNLDSKGWSGEERHPMMAVPATVRTVASTPEVDATPKSIFNRSIISLKKNGT